jgi:hypothetical protein
LSIAQWYNTSSACKQENLGSITRSSPKRKTPALFSCLSSEAPSFSCLILFPSFFILQLFFLFYFIILTFTYMCIHCLGHLFFPPQRSGHNLFCPLVLRFCWRENIRDNKKDIVFLLVWDKDSYPNRFLALLRCPCTLQPTLVVLYLKSSLLPSLLSMEASASLRLLYSLLYSKHINHFQVLAFLPFPYSSHVHSSLSVWPMFNNIAAFVLGL